MTREKLKNWAKLALNRSYWKSVLVAFVLSFTVGSASSSGGGSGDASELNFDNMSEEEIMILIGVFLVIMAIGLVLWVVGMLVKTFLFNPLHIGCQAYFCDGLESTDPNLGLMGKGFKQNYKNVAKTMFFRDLYLWLWSLLSAIPTVVFMVGVVAIVAYEDSAGGYDSAAISGILLVILFIVFFVGLIAAMIPYIMKVYEYWLIPYILADNPDLECKEVFALTKKMMTGYKWEAFVLQLSFFGWYLLSILTCGLLAIFYVEPYRAYTMAAFYKVRQQQTQIAATPDYSYNNMWNEQN